MPVNFTIIKDMVHKKRLAESFVAQGIITEEQLKKALQRQLIMGGKIGTNLIELSFISEDQLAEALSMVFHVLPASENLFRNIPPDVINLIPKDLAVKQKIIPIKKEQKLLTVAMENPSNLAIIDELSFMTGCRISTVVASESRIWLELEKHYSHPRPLRYIQLKPQEEEFIIERDSRGVTAEVVAPTKEKEMVITRSAEDEWLGGREEEPAYAVDYHKVKAPLVEEKPVPKAVPGPSTFQGTVNLLSAVETRDDAIKIVLDYISQNFDNVIFFVVSVAEAKAWNAKCKGIDDNKIAMLKVSFGGPSMFLTVKNSEEAYYGEISDFPFDNEFLGRIGRKRPIKVLLMPIMLKTKLVAMLYVDNDAKEIPSEKISEIDSIIEKLSISFEILLLKKKTAKT